MADFTVRGKLHGREVEIAWSEAEGFDDPTAMTGAMILNGEQVCATVTGPCYPAADKPDYVALLTALEALDVVEEVGGTALPGIIERLRVETNADVPEGATP